MESNYEQKVFWANNNNVDLIFHDITRNRTTERQQMLSWSFLGSQNYKTGFDHFFTLKHFCAKKLLLQHIDYLVAYLPEALEAHLSSACGGENMLFSLGLFKSHVFSQMGDKFIYVCYEDHAFTVTNMHL